jgi:predicted TPR repeat methyltransferase
MARNISGQELLENAYKLNTPSENVEFYKVFAPAYDSEFAARLGWNTPKAIAAAYHSQAQNDFPIADIGCGTGIVATELGVPREYIDGMDISPDMLAIAKEKKLYRNLYEVDLTGSLDKISLGYGAVLSAGTFTIGHLGPEPLRDLLNIARPGGLFIIGVYQAHFEKQNFSTALHALESEGKISSVKIDQVKIYSKLDHEHSNDQALILQYRKI